MNRRESIRHARQLSAAQNSILEVKAVDSQGNYLGTPDHVCDMYLRAEIAEAKQWKRKFAFWLILLSMAILGLLAL